MHFRKAGRQPRAGGGTDVLLQIHEIPDPMSAAEDEAEVGALYRQAVELIRAEFEEPTWKAFWRVVLDGRPATEVAADLGVTPAAVRKAKSRVLHRLKERLGDAID
jgi:RNA polymerase sigma-70 factor (ECF subfamily)